MLQICTPQVENVSRAELDQILEWETAARRTVGDLVGNSGKILAHNVYVFCFRYVGGNMFFLLLFFSVILFQKFVETMLKVEGLLLRSLDFLEPSCSSQSQMIEG